MRCALGWALLTCAWLLHGDKEPFMKSVKRTWLALMARSSPAAEIFNVLYRRIPFCACPDVCNAPADPGAQPIRNRRYSRLKICATAYVVLIAVGWLLCAQFSAAQDNPAPAAPPAEEQPAAKALSPEAEQALVEDTNKTAVLPDMVEEEGRVWRPPMVVFGRDVELKAGESVEALVVIGGSAKVHGRVREAAVAIGGDLDIDGQVGDAAVAVLGNITTHKGARVRGDAVAVGGRVEVADGARVHSPQGIEFPDVRWLRKWFVQCVLLMRPLSLKVTWVWFIAGIFLLFYILLAALFPRAVRACVNELTERPATTFCMGLLTILLLPLALAILGITGIGLLVVPFVLAAIFFGALIGRVALLEWVGWRIAHQFGAQSFNNPLTGLLLGALLVAALYLVPFLGLLTFAIISLWSLGGAVTAAFGGLRREMPEKPKAAAPPSPAPVMAAALQPSAPVEPVVPGATPGPTPSMSQDPALPPIAPMAPMAPPVVPEILTYPKARFWERLGAAFLDVILVSILCAVIHPIWPLIALAYFSALWAWRGTTVGGVVLGLKVVRVDGKPLTFPVSLVRSLAAAFSIIVLLLGYLWIAWDPEKQGWHDKIAGTVVLKLPRGTPLV
jgi:uncharacterized RDD family membrane protein YckC